MAKAIRLRVLKEHTFADRLVTPGQIIYAENERVANIELHLGWSELAVEQDEPIDSYITANLRAAKTPVPAKRAYKRRDMKAN